MLLFADTKYIIPPDSTLVIIMCKDKIIIDNILLHSNHISTLLHYFSYVDNMFIKYRLSFKFTKCDISKPHVEFFVHDLMIPAESMVKIDPLPPYAISFQSCIDLCEFYSRHYPWFVTNIKPLCKLQHRFHRRSIPIIS